LTEGTVAQRKQCRSVVGERLPADQRPGPDEPFAYCVEFSIRERQVSFLLVATSRRLSAANREIDLPE